MKTGNTEANKESTKAGRGLRVLVIDDEESHAEAVAETLERIGYECEIATSGQDGAERIEKEEFDLILTDLRMEDTDGIDILRKAKQELPDAEVVVITGYSEVKSAVEAMQEGAANYLNKPVKMAELRAVVNKTAERMQLAIQNRLLKQQLDEKFGFEGVVGESRQMHRVIEMLKTIAPTNAGALILGETGTGKELVAKALHNNSPRKNKPFIALNCTALNPSLLDSELFGHEPNSFTGADRLRKGRFEAANGGTLFLDEIGDMPLDLQAKLLRVIETQEVTRVGSNDPIKVNVRVLAATHKDLKQAVANGEFRQDLYQRIRVVVITLPPLRERREDISRLATHFLEQFSKENGKEVKRISDAVMQAMMAYHWEGNVRELRNLIQSMVIHDQDGALDMDDLRLADVDENLQQGGGQEIEGPDMLVGRPLAEVERYYIERTLELTEGNRGEAASLLGIGERTLYRMLNEWKLDDDIREAWKEQEGNIEAIAEQVKLKPEELERKLKKLGLAAEDH